MPEDTRFVKCYEMRTADRMDVEFSFDYILIVCRMNRAAFLFKDFDSKKSFLRIIDQDIQSNPISSLKMTKLGNELGLTHCFTGTQK